MTLWQTPGCLVMMVLLDSINEVWTLAAPSSVTMNSVDMRHNLTWSRPQTPCNTTILYSVQFQGEFELMDQNGSWVDAADCQRTPLTHCDLTHDLGSDSDYNIRVRAQCGSEASAWSQLSPAFNRRHTVPTVPNSVPPMVPSSSTKDQFTTIPAKDAQWKTPTTVTATVIIMSGLLFVVFWSIIHCQPRDCQAYFNKEQLPQSLHVQGVQIPMSPEETELCERVHVMPSDTD